MSWNQQLGKKLNKEAILQQILLQKRISRNEIINNTQLKKATVANLVKELIDEQLIIEAGKEASTGGRRSTLLQLNEHAGYSIGIDIGVNYLRGIITNLNGEIIFEKKYAVTDTTLSVYKEKIISFIHLLAANVPASPYHIIGMGIAVPGIIDQEGIILNAPNLNWKNVDLVSMLAEHFDFPIYISNEANAGAYAEFSLISHMKQQNILYVSIGYGIGLGIIINGELFLGEHGYSGESGHMIIHMNGKTCRCGQKGCWEAYASEHNLVQQLEEATGISDLTLEDAIQLIEDNAVPDAIIQQYSEYVSIGLMNLMNTFNPSKIVIGNRIALLKPFIEQPIKSIISNQASSFFPQQVKVHFSTLIDKGSVLGVASIIIQQFLQSYSSEHVQLEL